MRKKYSHVVLSTVALLIVACCALAMVPTGAPDASAASGPPIKIGFSMPLTGDQAAIGQRGVNGAKLAVEQINARGGAMGRSFELVTGDDQCDPKQGASVAGKFAAEKVTAVASYYCSGPALAGMPIIRESQMLFINIGAISSKLSEAGYDKFFTVIYTGPEAGRFTAKLAYDKLHLKTVVVLDDKTPALSDGADAFVATAQKLGGPQVLFHDHITMGDKDFTPFVTKLKGSNADGVYAACNYSECGLLIHQMREQNLKTVFIGDDALFVPTFVTIAGKDAAEGALIVTEPSADELDSAKQFVAAYKKSFPNVNPGNVGAYAYDAVWVIWRAYTAVGKVDNDAAAKWLHSLTKASAIQGATGKLFWRPDGTITEFFFSTYRVHDGDFQFARDLVMR